VMVEWEAWVRPARQAAREVKAAPDTRIRVTAAMAETAARADQEATVEVVRAGRMWEWSAGERANQPLKTAPLTWDSVALAATVPAAQEGTVCP